MRLKLKKPKVRKEARQGNKGAEQLFARRTEEGILLSIHLQKIVQHSAEMLLALGEDFSMEIDVPEMWDDGGAWVYLREERTTERMESKLGVVSVAVCRTIFDHVPFEKMQPQECFVYFSKVKNEVNPAMFMELVDTGELDEMSQHDFDEMMSMVDGVLEDSTWAVTMTFLVSREDVSVGSTRLERALWGPLLIGIS
jgi:hypothetical protein